jgi:hypothetical protein
MQYVGQVPAPPLDRFIDDIYCLTGVPRYRRMNVPPMPSAHQFVNLGGPVRLRDSDPSVPREFKDFTGHTPAEYLALRHRFPAEQGFPPDRGPMPAD